MIFLIDDDISSRLVLRRQFERLDWNAPILCFDSAKDALNYILEHRLSPSVLPDRIFLDLEMPEMNGWEFLKAFEKLDSSLKEKMKVYILSASTDKTDISRAKEYHSVKDYLIKPMRLDVLNRIMSAGITSQSPSIF